MPNGPLPVECGYDAYLGPNFPSRLIEPALLQVPERELQSRWRGGLFFLKGRHNHTALPAMTVRSQKNHDRPAWGQRTSSSPISRDNGSRATEPTGDTAWLSTKKGRGNPYARTGQ